MGIFFVNRQKVVSLQHQQPFTLEIMTTIDIKEADGGILAVISGRLDTAAARQFSTDMQPLMDQADRVITLDCADLQFVSSSGLRLFLSLRKETIAKGGKIIIKNMQDTVKSVFAMTGFIPLFEFA